MECPDSQIGETQRAHQRGTNGIRTGFKRIIFGSFFTRHSIPSDIVLNLCLQCLWRRWQSSTSKDLILLITFWVRSTKEQRSLSHAWPQAVSTLSSLFIFTLLFGIKLYVCSEKGERGVSGGWTPDQFKPVLSKSILYTPTNLRMCPALRVNVGRVSYRIFHINVVFKFC